MTIVSPVTHAFGLKRPGLMKPGERVLLGRHDTLFRICNRTRDTLYIALIYRYVWNFKEPPSWPAKGWFTYSPGDCSNVAVNYFFGMMAVVKSTKGGKLKPYFSQKSSTPAHQVVVRDNDVKSFKTEYMCLGKAPFQGSKDKVEDYRKCRKGQTKIPFNIMFKHAGGRNYTLNLNRK